METKMVEKDIFGEIEKTDPSFTGYVRVTTDDGGLNDYFLLMKRGKVLRGYAELASGESFSGEKVSKRVRTLSCEAIVEWYQLPKKTFEIFLEEFDATELKAPSKKRKKSPPQRGKIFRIANLEIPYETPERVELSSTNLENLIQTLERRNFTGYLRITAERVFEISEACIFFDSKPKACLCENSQGTRFGDEAMLDVFMLFFDKSEPSKGIIDVCNLEREVLDEILFKVTASQLAKSPKEILSSRESQNKKMRMKAIGNLGISEGKLVFKSPTNSAFSFEVLLRSAEDKHLDGYLWVNFENNWGLIFLDGGELRAALFLNEDTFYGEEALNKVYQTSGIEGMIEVYKVPPVNVKKVSNKKAFLSFDKELSRDLLLKKISSEMGEEFVKDIKRAKRFRREWKEKKNFLGGESGLS
ncbi:MAG: hypothetical protein ACE5K0_04315 [Candidatus Methanofastidiosia archaeon]